MPTFNAEKFIAESIDSVLGQSYSHIELIVIDDGSSDGTSEVIRPYLDRISYFRYDNFGGPSRPRNIGISKAKGEFVALCDSDDVLEPNAIEDAVALFSDFPEINVSCADYRIINEHGAVINESALAKHQDFRKDLVETPVPGVYLMDGWQMYTRLLRGLFLGTSAVVVRKQVFSEVGQFDESLKNSDDREMWLRIARMGHRFGFRDRILYSYRKHSSSLTNRGYLRLPSVIASFEIQLAFLQPGAEREYVERRIQSCRLGYAWGLRKDGRFSEAEEAYNLALAGQKSWAGFKGKFLTKFSMFIYRFFRN